MPRTVNHMHRNVLAPLGFDRRGNVCTRVGTGLHREIRFYSERWGDPETKGIQVLLIVQLTGLPEPMTKYRRDSLWTPLEPIRGLAAYPRPIATDPPPAELMEDVAGPGVSFLCHAKDLNGFAAMAVDVFECKGGWGPFENVFPQGTAPLQAAAFAAALAGDVELTQRMVTAVEKWEPPGREKRDFHKELARVSRRGGAEARHC
jgi:hypothetical protein